LSSGPIPAPSPQLRASSPALTGRTGRLFGALLAAAFFLLVFALLLLSALHKQLNHDENMYVSSGILLHSGLLPYKDYPYFQMPLLTLVYAAAMWSAGDQLLIARALNTVCAFLTCVILFVGALRLSRGAPAYVRAIIAVSGVLLFIANPELEYASGLAWNHDLPILLTVAGIALLSWALLREPSTAAAPPGWPWLPVLAGGLLLGLAGAARITFLVVVPPLVLVILLVAPASGSTGFAARVRQSVAFSAGALAGLAPALLFLLNDPSSFVFGNVIYHQFNEQYWLDAGYTRAMTLDSKLAYFRDVLSGEPFNWLLLLAGGLLVPALLLARAGLLRGRSLAALLPGIAAIALFVSALIPSPTWLQYFYAPYALAVFAVVYGVACLSANRWRYPAVAALLAVTLICAFRALPNYQALDGSLSLSDSTTAQVYQAALDIRRAVPHGTIVTLAPVYGLEAGLNIYPGLASGPFAPRVANLLPPGTKANQRISSIADLVAAMQARPPEAVLVGTEGALEDPLAQFAFQHGYRKIALPSGLTLWVRG
jgi:hypothetical protein